MTWKILTGDCRERLAELDERSVHTVVTSPPYFGLRDYGADGQIGLEEKPEEFIAELVDVFRTVRRVLRDDGTLWLNLGDSYADRANRRSDGESFRADRADVVPAKRNTLGNGIKAKDLIGIPWAVAFALRADGWYLRSDIVWHKPNPMPESVTDRPTRSHEHIFLLSKCPRYYYDADAIREPLSGRTLADGRTPRSRPGHSNEPSTFPGHPLPSNPDGRNKRDVWTVSTKPFGGAHFATFPPDLIEPCVLAGSPHGGTVLDPFAGAGTTGVVAARHGRSFVGIELNAEYAEMARRRIRDDAPLLNVPLEAAA